MIDKPIDKSLDFSLKDESLFEYTPFKKSKGISKPIINRLRAKFHSNISKNKPLHSNSIPKKQIVIKNIGTMGRTHLLNAIKYTLKSSSLLDELANQNVDSSLDFHLDGNAFNEVGELVNLNQIIDDWHSDCFSNDKGKKALHLVFSLKETHSDLLKDILQNAVKETLQANLSEYKWIMIPHSHQNKPHLHIIINRSNIFSGKKLHFDSKQSLADFYDTMREDFAYNLFIYSQGRLDYTNEVCNRDFRAALLDKKIQDLENISLDNSNALSSSIQSNLQDNQGGFSLQNQSDLDSNLIKQDIDSLALQQEAMSSLNNKVKNLSLEKANLEKNLRNRQIYLSNVSKKIESIISQGKNPTALIAKKDLLSNEIDSLKVSISYKTDTITQLSKGIKQLFDSNENFKDFTKHFNSFHKKKALLSSFKGFEKYLSKDCITKLNHIKAEVEQSQFALNQNFKTLQASMSQMVISNNKSNIYTLSKNLHKLMRYKNIVRALEFSDLDSKNNKSKALVDLAQIEQELKELMLQRMEFLRLQSQEAKNLLASYYKKNQQAYDENPYNFIESMISNPQSFKEYKTLARIHKKLVFLDKELAVATKIAKKLEIAKIQPQIQHTIKNPNEVSLSNQSIEMFGILKKEVDLALESKQAQAQNDYLAKSSDSNQKLEQNQCIQNQNAANSNIQTTLPNSNDSTQTAQKSQSTQSNQKSSSDSHKR